MQGPSQWQNPKQPSLKMGQGSEEIRFQRRQSDGQQVDERCSASGKRKSKPQQGTSLLVEWLRLHLAMQGRCVSSLVREHRFRTPQATTGPVTTTRGSVHRSERPHMSNEDPACHD